MSYPKITLGGVEIVLHAGAPELAIETIGGETIMRLSQGAGVLMRHWSRRAGTLSGQGWMPPGLDGLDYSGLLELRTTQVENVVGAGRVHQLTSTPRPDVAPWAQALVAGEWVPTPCTVAAGVATAAAVAGATLYQVSWMPKFQVLARAPAKGQGGSLHTWSIAWEEA